LSRVALSVAVFVFGAVVGSARHARAQPAEILGVRLEYRAPEACPDSKSFQAQVLARTRRLEFRDASADVVWSITLSESTNGTRGTLLVRSTQLGRLERHVAAASCEQVVNALSLVAALSVDPDASLTVPEAKATPSKPPHTPAPRAVTAAPSAEVAPEAGKTKLALGLTLTGRSGIAAGLTWAPRPYVGVNFRSPGGYTWGLSVSAMQAHGSAAVDVGRANFTWSLGRVEAFPLRLSYGNLRFEPAVFFEAGQLRARGVGIVPSAEVKRPALFTGALGRISWLGFGLLLLELEGGPLLTLERDRFYLFENNTVFEIPTVTGFVAGGVGLEFL
jgi:hypothetical protein